MSNTYATVTEIASVPFEFVKRRVHSITGFFLIFFLIEHLLTNSEASLFFGEDGIGFIRQVNLLHSLPYLPLIEIGLLGIPFIIHTVLGVQYLFSAAINVFPSNGAVPSLPQFSRNHAYTWQRITAVILVLGLGLHVWDMRFHRYPDEVRIGGKPQYILPISMDKGLYTLSPRLNVLLFDREALGMMTRELEIVKSKTGVKPQVETYAPYVHEVATKIGRWQDSKEKIRWYETLTKHALKEKEVIAVAEDFGTIVLLNVRDTFKSIPYAIAYSIFVIAAAFHAANGLWTFCITWGITKNERGRCLMRMVSTGLMLFFLFLGLAAIWGVYWINLYE